MAYEVCMLWRALLLTPQLQLSRYQLFPGSDTDQKKEPIHVHQLLYNEMFCGSTCQKCLDRLNDYDYIRSFPRVENYYPHSVTKYRQGYLLGVIGRDRQIVSYQLRIEDCFGLSGQDFEFFPIPPSHPFLSEAVLAPISRRGMKDTDTKQIPSLQFIRSPGMLTGITPKNNEIQISASTTVGDLTLHAWETMKTTIYAEGRPIKRMYCVRFTFPTLHRGRNDGSELPVLQLDLEAA
ncbi:hypothetical protein TWF718_005117 [Orbilia javanica]|uniref:Uncharacterized protein n=1 Tax=Orbilia javanica TaxID=47235 RepID=A0AAN8RLI4_9PEZI